jgi:hypothetical protein
MNTQNSKFYYKGSLVNNYSVSYDKNDFIVDTEFGPTFESFGSDCVILYDDKVCYFKWFITNSNNKVFATQYGDIVLNYDQIKTGKRLRKLDLV